MKRIALALLLALPACEELPDLMQPASEPATRSVHVMSRTWAVSQVSDTPVVWKAVRDNNNLNPYGPPAALRTTQAIRAIETATQCKAIRSSMYQNISGEFFSQVACK